MRVPNMSAHDKSTDFSNGAFGARPDQHSPTDEYYNNDHTPTPSNMRVNVPPSVPESNGNLQSPIMSPTYMPARQPINDAVASAFQTTDSSVSPEFIQLITQSVIQQMQAHKLSIPTAQPVQPPQSSLATPVNQTDNTSSFATSPITDRSQVYTPPSPRRPASMVNAHGYETGIRREFSPFHQSSDEEAVFSEPESTKLRPEPPRRVSTEGDFTVLEKIWGNFFDNSGDSTKRLETFLRGIAVHLIEDYEPKNSLVITPQKMQRYYEEMRLTEQPEIYPWQAVFDDKASSLSRLFREPDVRVEHHLVQSTPIARPDTPGLTPHGFAAWMTLVILAHPDQEFERLLYTVRKMPINNPDTKDRFPKELSRRLFPAVGDDGIANTLAKRISKFCKVDIQPRKPSNAESESAQSQSSPPSTSRKSHPPAPFVEDASEDSDHPEPRPAPVRSSTATNLSEAKVRETVSRSSVSTAPDNPIETDSSDVPTPKPLERERNPYVVRPGGGGKTYEATSSSGDEKRVKVNTSRSRRNSTAQDDLRRIKSMSASQPRRQAPPPIAIHQRDNTQPDDPESGREHGRARRSTINDDQGSSIQRTRSNATHGAEVQPSRRRRSNSTYGNEANATRYHPPKRSPSLSKSGFDLPRASAPEVKTPNYPPPPNAYTNTYSNSSVPPQYDYRNQAQDPRDSRNRDRERERERDRDRDRDRRASKTRSSVAAPSAADTYDYASDHYRQPSGYPASTLR